MKTLRSVDDLHRLREGLAARPREDVVIRVCSTGCRALGALEVCDALEREIADRALGGRVRVVRTGCHGLCAGAVAVVIDRAAKGKGARRASDEIFYQTVTPEDAAEIIETTVLGGKTIRRLCWGQGRRRVSRRRNVPFYRQQMRLVLRNCGLVDPRSVAEAIARGAYAPAAKALSEMSPEQVIAEVTASGLRGRGGAGFPTGRKWQFARAAAGEPKYVICNADEGDPGAFMDRALLEGDPHLILEGMIIAAYAIGAEKGYIYIRAEYPLAVEQLGQAVAEARQVGLLGRNILGTGFDFEIEIERGAGAYVCGEETALIAAIEGRRGMPRPRPPYPATRGLYGKPTNTNNVETLANVPRILESGAAAYAAMGTDRSKGTKIFSVSGEVRSAGLVEVPMGATLRHIVFDICGGLPRGRRFKAAQMGGPCGGFLGEEHLDLPIDCDSLKAAGAMLGCGGIIVVDHRACMVDLARHAAAFAVDESCGQCVPCRLGTRQMLDLLVRIAEGQGSLEDLGHLERIGELIDQTSFCGMAPNPVLSTIRYFRGEYETHILQRRCPTGACRTLPSSPPATRRKAEGGQANA